MNSVVGDLLNRKGRMVHHIDPGATVFDAISKMVDLNIGSLLVVDEKQGLTGIVTSNDYLKKVALMGRSSRTSFVIEIMDPDLVFINEAFTIPRCLYLMTEHRVHYLPVIEQGEVSGIVSIGDCAREIAYDHDITVQYFTEFIERRYPL